MKTSTLITIFATLFLVACQPYLDQTRSQGESSEITMAQPFQEVIYGDDNRIDFFNIMDPSWAKIAKSTVAMIPTKALKNKGGRVIIKGVPFGPSIQLCEDEPFYDQPRAAICSGFLVGPDIIVTAGHCVESESDCNSRSLVFGFAYKKEGKAPTSVSKNSVYSCKEIIHTEFSRDGADYAILRLDRPVVGYAPLKVRTEGTIGDNEALTIIGHPSGIPLKLADGANVRNNLNAEYFVTNTDSYGGNSGSAVFNSKSQEIEGILVRGESDYISNMGCRQSVVCDEGDCRGEDVTRIENIFNHLSIDDLRP